MCDYAEAIAEARANWDNRRVYEYLADALKDFEQGFISSRHGHNPPIPVELRFAILKLIVNSRPHHP